LTDLSANRLFRIPQYQRSYSWSSKERQDMFEDIDRLKHRPDQRHFMATVVGLKRGQKTIVTDEYSVIEVVDGQQRLTTLILGDSLLVMASLAEKEGMRGKVQMIYMDPPYGIKFRSNWQVSTRSREVKDGNAGDLTRQPEQIRAFRDTWELGISSYLSYLRDRLTTARGLLSETGSIFVQIGDENLHLAGC
jgi:adenine specific DNA methylase Mod